MSTQRAASTSVPSASYFRLKLKGLDRPLHFHPEEFYWAQGYDRLLAGQIDWIRRNIERHHLQLKEDPLEVVNIALVAEGATLNPPGERVLGWWDAMKLSMTYLMLRSCIYRLCHLLERCLYRARNRWFRFLAKLSRLVRGVVSRSTRLVAAEWHAAISGPTGSQSALQKLEPLAITKDGDAGGTVGEIASQEGPSGENGRRIGVAFLVAPSAALAVRIKGVVVIQKCCLVALREWPLVVGDGMQLIRRPTTSVLSLVRACLAMRGSDERFGIGFADARQARMTLVGLRGMLGSSDIVITAGSARGAVEDWGVHQDLGHGLALHRKPPVELLTSYRPTEPRNGWPRISIVTVNYNQGRYLEDCLRSILDQEYPNLEFIIVDGNSTDCSREVLERYRDKVSTMIIEPDDGQSAALNKGFRLATGDIMNWICSDDMLEPGSLFHIGASFAESKADLVAGGCRVIDDAAKTKFVHHSAMPDETVLSAGEVMKFMSNWQMGDFFFQPETFFSRAIWEKAGGAVREHLFYAMDYDMFIRMAMAGARIRCIPNIIGVSRQHAQQKTQHATMEYLPQIHGILSEFREMISSCAEVGRSFDR